MGNMTSTIVLKKEKEIMKDAIVTLHMLSQLSIKFLKESYSSNNNLHHELYIIYKLNLLYNSKTSRTNIAPRINSNFQNHFKTFIDNQIQSCFMNTSYASIIKL